MAGFRRSDPWLSLVVIAAVLVAIGVSIVVPLLNVLWRPEYRARYAVVDPVLGVGGRWLVDVRFGSRTWILANDAPSRLGVLEVPSSNAANDLLTSVSENDSLLAYQEFGWPIPSMCWHTGIADAVADGESLPVRVSGGTHGTGPVFSMSTPTGNHRWMLHATYLPGFISWWRVCGNVLTIAGSLVFARWLVRSLLFRMRDKPLANKCPNCGHLLTKRGSAAPCSECGWTR